MYSAQSAQKPNQIQGGSSSTQRAGSLSSTPITTTRCSLMELGVAPMATDVGSHLDSHQTTPLARCQLTSLKDINNAHMAINHSSPMDIPHHALMASRHQTNPSDVALDTRHRSRRKQPLNPLYDRVPQKRRLESIFENDSELALLREYERSQLDEFRSTNEPVNVVTLESSGPPSRHQLEKLGIRMSANVEQQFDPNSKPNWLGRMPKRSKGDAALNKARIRNVKRLREANDRDREILGKYLPSDVRSLFPFGVAGPDDFRPPSRSWVSEVIAVAGTICPVPKKPFVVFECSQSALEHNTKYLESCGWDLDEVFRQHEGTTVDHVTTVVLEIE